MSDLRFFTSESVTEGHPDKVCDRIADAILDELLRADPLSRVALEVLCVTGLAHIAGEVTTGGYVDIPAITRQQICSIGYTSSRLGFDGNTCGVTTSIDEQSPDIAAGVGEALEIRGQAGEHDRFDRQGAGDQGMMFGYASDETPDLMPLPIWLSHRLSRRLAQVRRENIVELLGPDGKSQVSIGYDDQNQPRAISTVIVSTQHSPEKPLAQLRAEIDEHVVQPVLRESGLDLDLSQLRVLVNPAGPFALGGPAADAGVTGRKLMVDTYGGMARHGGGAFSGKDPSKVDRSAAYALRWVAKNIVAAGLAKRCEVQVAYAIGAAHPVGLYVETFGTGKVSDYRLAKAVEKAFDLRPAAIIEALDLRRPIYLETAAYGHFGRAGFSWEALDRREAITAAL